MMRRNPRSHGGAIQEAIAAALVGALMLLARPLPASALGVGDSSSWTFGLEHVAGSTSSIRGARLSILGAPSWFVVNSELSFLGPYDIVPGETVDFSVDFTLGPGYSSDALIEMDFVITHDSPDARPQRTTYHVSSRTGLRTFRSICTDDLRGSCGKVVAEDTTPPFTELTAGLPKYVDSQGRLFVSSTTSLLVYAEDPQVADAETSGLAFVGFLVDRYASSLGELNFVDAFSLAEGTHSVAFGSRDLAGNADVLRSSAVFVDATAPRSELLIGTPSATGPDGSSVVSSRTGLLLVSSDPATGSPASGILDAAYSVNGASFALVSGTFTLAGADGPLSLRWLSRDNVWNVEPVRERPLVLDNTAPSLSISCPSSDSPAFCRIFDASAPLRGTVHDLHLAVWRLESAPGRAAASGFALISSGTTDIDGLLGILDASALSGFVTLRLSAEDLVGNSSVRTVEALAGDPARVFTLGGRKAFEKPSGVAVDSSSRVYVADAGKDRVFVYSPDGPFVRSYGTDGRREPAFKQPSGVAVDAAGNVWVADTGNHRVVKLSPEGGVLAMVGRYDTRRGLKRFKPGKGPGEFKRPSAIAVDPSGRTYVADTGNRRIQVLAPDGSFLRAIAMPPVPGDAEPDEEDGDGESPRSLGVPVGVAVDGAGLVYASDRKGRRVVVFSATGELARMIDRQFEQPWGVAVSRDGKCLAVSDRESGIIRRFDEGGRPLLTFRASEKPLGLALADVLYVADAEKAQVLGFGMPVGTPIAASGEQPGQNKGTGGFHAAARASAEAPTSVLAKVGRAGGAVFRSDRAGVEVPERALDEELELGVHAAAPSALRADGAKGASLAEAGPAVELAPHGLVFDRPVVLSLPYDKARGWRARDLAVYRFDEEAGRWAALPTTVDEAAGLARAETSHFSVYQALGHEASQPAAPSAAVPAIADTAFVFRDLYAFPNPSRGARRPTIRLQVGVADSAEVNIYDVSGERVHSAAFGPPVVLDDGNGKGPLWTYDLAWDAGGAGSGVYIYVVTAKKAGQADIRKSGRLAVIR